MAPPLTCVGKYLRQQAYQFVTVTPLSHQRNLSKGIHCEDPLRQLFGWSTPVDRKKIPTKVLDWLIEAEVLRQVEDDQVRSEVRFSSRGELILVHSAFPTEKRDSVFFGPDSYRFANFLEQNLDSRACVVDIGTGTGIGALVARKKGNTVLATDVNERALMFCGYNSKINDLPFDSISSDILADVPPGFDAVIANPPFIIDDSKRAYRDGGENHGTEISSKIFTEALDYLRPGGQLLLYTAAPFVNGEDLLRDKIMAQISPKDMLVYTEIDPDIFGEELSTQPYREVERLAAVGVNFRKG